MKKKDIVNYLNKVICGENLTVMREMPANSVDTIITDPPYGLGFMGKEWDTFKPENVEALAKSDARRKPRKDERNVKGFGRSAAAGRYDRSVVANIKFQLWFTAWGCEALRVIKPGGTLLIFGGTRTYHRLACAIEESGWTIKDCIMWIYGSGFPKATDISKQLDKQAGAEREVSGQKSYTTPKADNSIEANSYGISGGSLKAGQKAERLQEDITAPATDAAKLWDGWKSHGLKPAYEPILVAMKPNGGSYANNAIVHGVAGLNIDATRIPLNGDYKCKANGRPSQTGLCDNYDPAKANQQDDKGRYPANVILDKAAAAMLDEQSGDNCGAFAPVKSGHDGKSKGIYGDYDHKGDDGRTFRNDSGGASRFFYCAKASKSERNAGCEAMEPKVKDAEYRQPTGDAFVDQLHGCGKPAKNNHPTVKPLALMEYLCRLTKTPTGGIVLDPFAGSGTTCLAAYNTGRHYIGIEREAEYVKIARARLSREGHLF